MTKTARIALCLFVSATVGITILNILFPRSFLLFGIDHLSFLPVSIQVLWCILTVTATVIAVRSSRLDRLAPYLLPLVCLMLAASLFVLRTQFPVLHGDGDMGGSPQLGVTPTFDEFPAMNGRLQSFINHGLSRLVPEGLRFKYYHCGLGQDTRNNSSWILLVIATGLFTIAVVLLAVLKLPFSNIERLGLTLFLLCSPTLLSAYGHFDSYAIPILMAYGWMLLMLLFWCGDRPWLWYILGVGMIPIAFWAHPILGLLAAYSGIALISRLVQKHTKQFAIPTALLMGIVVGMAPFIIGRGGAGTGVTLTWLVHEKSMSLLQAALPTALLVIVLLVGNHRMLRSPMPAHVFSIATLTSSVTVFFSLKLGFGFQDEFLYAMLAVPVLASAAMLWISTGRDAQVMICAGLFSLFLYLPRAYVYSGSGLLSRFESHVLQGRCEAYQTASPYRILAQLLPVETEEYRQRRLDILKRGIEEPLPHLEKFVDETRGAYVAWCYEFGQTEEGTKQLIVMIARRSPLLVDLWRADSPFHTGRYHNISPAISRRESRWILSNELAKNPSDDVLRGMLTTLLEISRAQPAHD